MKVYLAIMGIVALIAMAMPSLIVVGMFFLIVPGLILAYSPTLFFYPYVAYIGTLLLRPITKYPAMLAIGCCMFFACAVPLFVNYGQRAELDKLSSFDVANDKKITITQTVALLRTVSSERKSEPLCDAICQRLLYNGAVRRVLVGESVDLSDPQLPEWPVTAFYIARQDICPAARLSERSEPHLSLRKGKSTKFLPYAVRLRIASGDCLMQESVKLSETGLILNYHSAGLSKAQPVSIERFEVAGFSQGHAHVLLRRTRAWTQVLSTPLMYAARGAGSSGMDPRFGFVREVLSNNVVIKSSSEYELLFGDAIDPVTGPAEEQVVPLFKKQLANPEEQLSLLEPYLGILQRQKQAGSEDISLLVQLIDDTRAEDLPELPYTVSAIGADADSLAEPLMERLERTKIREQKKLANNLSEAISRLPDASILRIGERIDVLAQDKDFKSYVIGNLKYKLKSVRDKKGK